MFETGQLVFYANTGVCRVKSIGPPPSDFPEELRKKQFYCLAEEFGPNVIYIPIDTKSFMRPIISKEEAVALISKMPETARLNEESNSQKVWADDYKALLNSHSCHDLVRLLKTVHLKNRSAQRRGKKPWMINQQYGQRAEKLLYGELAAALGIRFDEVEAYIEARLQEAGYPPITEADEAAAL